MRFLHTGDWHLGRMIRGRSRIDESARVLDDVVRIAIDERVDAMLIAGDTFDTFSPPSEAQKLLYETLTRVLVAGVKVVMIAGNHDSVPRLEAVSGILSLAGVTAVGAPPHDDKYEPVTIASRDGTQTATIVAVPWIPERLTVDYETLFGPPNEKYQQYAANMERALRFYCSRFQTGNVCILLGHMLVSGISIRSDSGERKLHMGDVFAVPGQLLPSTAQYIALGHVHKPQPVPGAPVAGAAFYAGSLLQLDFGEAEQKKSVRVVDVAPGLPADSREVPVSGGIGLRNVTLRLDNLASHAGKYGDDYLRVHVELDAPAASLFDQVREILPNAVDVVAVRADTPKELEIPTRIGVEPHELISRYYESSKGAPIPADLLALFNEMYAEAQGATA